jgi:hypothetical protein
LFIQNRLDHLATPLHNNSTRYSTRRNSEGLVNFIPEPEKVYRRRLNRLTSRRILDNLGSVSISNIQFLFIDNSSIEMDDLYAPCDFTVINGYLHVILEKASDKLPSFQGNNVVSVRSHIKAFTHCVNKWCGTTHEDVKMKLFVLSLEEDALDWFTGFADNKFKTIKELIDVFTKRWGDRKENRHLLAELNSIKKNENETMEEFNVTRRLVI